MTDLPLDAMAARPSERLSPLRLLIANRLAAIGVVVLAVVIVVAVLAPILPLGNPDATDPATRLKPVLSAGHWLGTDQLGRDILARLIWGTRTSLLVGASATLIAAVLGSLIGLVAGYAGGWLDEVLMRLIDMVMAFPYILLALAIVAVLGPSLINALYAIAIVNIPFFARNVRGVTLSLRRREFVEASRLSGKTHPQILFGEVLPGVMPVIVITISTTVGWMILETAGLSFLGLGAQPPQADLGSMLGDGRMQLFVAPHVMIVPGVMIFILVMSINLFGDGIRDVLDPRLKSGALGRPLPVTRLRRPVPPPRGIDTAALLEVRDLAVAFESGRDAIPAVNGVSFTLDRGECLGLVGESGSGKSVTALALLGLVTSPPGIITGGAVYLDGRDLLGLPSAEVVARRGGRVAYVFQDPLTTLHPLFSVGEQIAEAILAHQRVSHREAHARAVALMTQVGIREAAQRASAYPHELSGGQRQRIGIAMALANDPDIIIADEPTTALDVTVQARLLELLQELRRERGLALLLITHNFGVVASICDRVAVMRNGVIVETGKTREVLDNPRHPYTRRLIACVPEPGRGKGFISRIRGLFDSPAREGGTP
jgi:peptide/nickel transport system permease protein